MNLLLLCGLFFGLIHSGMLQGTITRSELPNAIQMIGPSAAGSVHVDLPGEHGNPINGVPIVHREIGTGTGPLKPIPQRDTQNILGVTPINKGLERISNVPAVTGNVHVDLPGEHGNPINGNPIIHREGAAVEGLVGPGQSVVRDINLPSQNGIRIDNTQAVRNSGTSSLNNVVNSVGTGSFDSTLGLERNQVQIPTGNMGSSIVFPPGSNPSLGSMLKIPTGILGLPPASNVMDTSMDASLSAASVNPALASGSNQPEYSQSLGSLLKISVGILGYPPRV